MTVRLPSKAQFDSLRAAAEALAREWAERECTSFDAAVRRAAGGEEEGSIWDMPEIDSKRCVSLLGELESLFGNDCKIPDCKIPVSVIKPGGYASVDDLIAKLVPKIRERCLDAPNPSLAAVAAAASNPPPPQVIT
jgi:hypothetical protein